MMGPPPDGTREAIWLTLLDFVRAERRSLALKGRAEPMAVVVERPGARRDTDGLQPRV